MHGAISRLRRLLGQMVSASVAERAPVSVQTAIAVAVRAGTADGKELRLLLDVHLDGAVSRPGAESFVHAVTVPAARRWVRQRSLAQVEESIGSLDHDIAAAIHDELAELGVGLLAVDTAAVEHLLIGPAAGPDEDGRHGQR